VFRNRVHAGRMLAGKLEHLRGQKVVVLGLPRGGVPVAFEVARELGAPLDVILVRKLGVPYQPELAMGAIGEGGVVVRNREVIRLARVPEETLEQVRRQEMVELERRAIQFRGDRPPVAIAGRVAVLVDDGIATGSTMKAAVEVARAAGASRVVVATPVAPPDIDERLGEVADEIVVVDRPYPFYAIGEFYLDFTQTSDREVTDLLAQAARMAPASHGQRGTNGEITIPVASVPEGGIGGLLTIPDLPRGAVVFAHGSGSSRHSPRNRFVADVLNEAGLATLLVDLLTPGEGSSRAAVFDVELLAGRLVAATAWLTEHHQFPTVGYFGASTGAAAALTAAARPDSPITAVVSRGGRPDLAGEALRHVRCPTLLIVGGRDEQVMELNRAAQEAMTCETRLAVIPGATHLFEEPGALEAVSEIARDWFLAHMTAPAIG
jgi:putative phosphoribosyl transferase